MMARVPLADVCRIEKGKTGIMKAVSGPYPLVTTSEERRSHENYDFDCEAVCVPLVSSTGHGHASLNRVHLQSGKFALGTILAAVIPNDPKRVSAAYLHAYLSATKDYTLVPLMRGGANVTLTVGALKSVTVPLPDMATQRSIAEAHGRATRECRKLSEALSRQQASVADLRQTILQLAVMGRLVSQDPNDEPASQLLKKIEAEKKRLVAEGRSKKPKPLVPIDEGDAPYELPNGWAWSSVQELGQPGEAITYGILKPVWRDTGVPTVRVTEMKTGVIDVDALPRCDPVRADKFSKTRLLPGDLLVSKDGTIGKTAFVPLEVEGGNITQHVLRFPINSSVCRAYIRTAVDAPVCQSWMAGETKGVALKGVNVGDFRRMPVPLPPLPEQHRIVAKVDALMSLCDDLEAKLKQSQSDGEKLMASIVNSLVEAA